MRFRTVTMKYSAILLVLLAAAGVQAEVYKSINSRGEVIYSDVPSQGAERLRMPELPTYTPAPLPVAPAAPASAVAANVGNYATFTVIKPHEDEAIRSNAGILNVSLALEPELQIDAGHLVRFFLDGKPLGEPVARLSASFNNIDRGTHTISAEIIDESGNTLVTAAPVTFHLLRAIVGDNVPGGEPGDSGGGSTGGGGSNGDSSSGDTGDSGDTGTDSGSTGAAPRSSPSLGP
jgi:hypothetical protein